MEHSKTMQRQKVLPEELKERFCDAKYDYRNIVSEDHERCFEPHISNMFYSRNYNHLPNEAFLAEEEEVLKRIQEFRETKKTEFQTILLCNRASTPNSVWRKLKNSIRRCHRLLAGTVFFRSLLSLYGNSHCVCCIRPARMVTSTNRCSCSM